MYSVSIRNIENNTVPRMKPATLAPSTVLVRRMPNRISGSRTRFSQTTKPTSSAPAATNVRDRAGRAPSPLVALGDREHQGPQTGRDQDGAESVEAADAGVSALAQQQGHEGQGDESDGDVDEEDPLPRQGVGQYPAEQDAGSGSEATDGTPHAERDVAVTTLLEGGHQDRQGGGRDGGRAETLQGSRADQGRLGPGETAEQRADGEGEDADDEDPSSAEDVGAAAAEQQEAAEDQGIRADDPLQVGLREVQIGSGSTAVRRSRLRCRAPP